MKKYNRPRDIFERAKLIGDIAVGNLTKEKALLAPTQSQLSSRKGGLNRAKKLSPERKKEIAQIAAKKRWSSDKESN